MAMTTELRIPEMVYVKFQRRKRKDDDYLLGFMTPYDPDDPKFKDTKHTVDRWSSHGNRKSLVDKQAWVGYNEPMKGFKILHTVSRSMTSNKVWRIRDPRGFELEISSYNLSQMLPKVVIERGTIKDECVWCRNSNGDNWLIPTDCKEYEEAKAYTEVRNTRISLRDVDPGDIVTLHDGRNIQYLGGFYYVYDKSGWASAEGAPIWTSNVSVSRRYYFLIPDKEGEFTRLDSKSSIKVGNLVKKADKPWSKREAEAKANEALRLSKNTWRANLVFLSATKFEPSDIEVCLEAYDTKGYHSLLGGNVQNGPVLVADISEGVEGAPGFYILTDVYSGHYRMAKLEKEPFLSGLAQKAVRQKQRRNSYWSRGDYYTPVVAEVPYNESIEAYDWKKVVVKVKGRKMDVCWGHCGSY